MAVGLADVFRLHGHQYQAKYNHSMLPSHRRVIRAVEQCRSAALGGHVYYCPDCDQTQYRYHSCRNRHCPQCQTEQGQEWFEKQKDLLLPVPYYLLTFTLPNGFREMARSHQKLIYNLLFRISARATQKLARDLRYVGGQIGMIGVLHTWGRNLSYHPHVHFIVPAGGWSEDGRGWRSSRNNFLLPVRALSKIFRAKFRQAIQKTALYDSVPASVWCQEWVVHCQAVGDGVAALKYLAPYIFRVAISNRRILKLSEGRVTFRYKASGSGKHRVCTLPAEEFIRRFLQHVLPKGFVKVRYYGLFSPGLRQRLAFIREYLGYPHEKSLTAAVKDQKETNSSTDIRCPECGKAMQLLQIIRPKGRWPPQTTLAEWYKSVFV